MGTTDLAVATSDEVGQSANDEPVIVRIEKKITGFSVVSKEQQQFDESAEAAATDEDILLPDVDPTELVLDGAPQGFFDAKRWGGDYLTSQGKQSLYVLASVMNQKGIYAGEELDVPRVVEMFMPAGQREDIQPWVTVTMMLASLCVQQGVSMQKVLGRFQKANGSENILFPLANGKKRYFSSEVQVIGQAFKNLMHQLGVMDEDGNDVPYHMRTASTDVFSPVQEHKSLGAAAVYEKHNENADDAEFPGAISTCAKCGVKAVAILDKCPTCLNCGDSKCS